MKENSIELYRKLARLQWLVHRHRMNDITNRGPFADTSKGQGRVLALLKIQPVISTKDLAYLLGIRQQSLNEVLNRLENGGYIERKPSETDRRVVMVHLTEKGKEVQQPSETPEDIFACLTEEEQTAFAEYLDRVIAAAEEEFDFDPDDVETWKERVRASLGEECMEPFMRLRGMFRMHIPNPHCGGFPGECAFEDAWER